MRRVGRRRGVAMLACLAGLLCAVTLLGGLGGEAAADVPLAVSAFPTPTAGAEPDAITLGPDGELWFTEVSANKIGAPVHWVVNVIAAGRL